MEKTLLFFDSKTKNNLVGMIHYYEKDDNIEFDVYRPGKYGLQLVDINGNHIYKDHATNEQINSFVDSYIKDYFDNYYYEEK
jgi:hypothetical protein|nr:MAG TPA: hypothetical protein [Caudoviricetes sp.]DAM43761.1 MAG TPA: hypothetical protein [Caudoviricetes sp.]